MAVDLRREPLLFVERDLSKSLFLAGVQCPKRLWLEIHRPELAAPPEPVRRAAMAEGVRVGVLARERHPGGVLVAETSGAERATRAALASGAPAVFEAAFRGRGARIRADLLVRLASGGFELVEVKASTRVRAEHELDLALQLVVARAAGVAIDEASVLHLDRGYRHEGGPLDLERLFVRRPLGAERMATLTAEVEQRLADLAPVAGGERPPDVAVGDHCERPRRCPFHEICHGERPTPAAIAPDAFRARVSDHARDAIRRVAPPLRVLDVEAFAPAIPLFPGTRPYEPLPFLWAIATLGADGEATDTRDDLVPPGIDPRRPFATSLVAAAGDGGTILTYGDFERRLVRDLAAALPELAGRLEAVAGRIVDLHALLGGVPLDPFLPRNRPARGKPAPIRDGGEAAAAYAELARGGVPEEEVPARERRLREYCRRDVAALAALHRWLRDDGRT